MRSLALLLMLANMVLLTWQLQLLPWLPWQPVSYHEPSPPLRSVSNLPQLVLLNERVDNFQKVVNSDPSDLPLEKEKKIDNFQEVVNSDPSDLPLEKEKEIDNFQEVVNSDLTNWPLEKEKEIDNFQKVVKSDLTNLPLPTKKVEDNKLKKTEIREGSSQPTVAPANLVADNQSAPIKKPKPEIAKSTPSWQCFQAGPYLHRTEAKQTIDRIQKINGQIKTELHSQQTDEVTGIQVYVPPLANQLQAQQQLLRLTPLKSQLGIVEPQIIAKGELKNAILIGVFENQNNVQRLIQNLKAKGFEVKTEPRYGKNKRTTYWNTIKMAENTNKKNIEEIKQLFRNQPLEVVSCQ